MAVLFITEFSATGKNERNALDPIAMAPSAADQTVAIGAASVQSALFNAATNKVRIVSDVVCSVKFGTNPTATTTTMRLAADSPEYIGVPAGGTLKVAVIANV